MAERVRARMRPMGLAAAAVAAVTLVVYVITLVSEGQELTSRVVLVAAVLLGATLAAVLGGFSPSPSGASGLLGASAGVLVALGILAMFSVGLLLMVAGILAVVGAVEQARASGAWALAGLGFSAGVAAAFLPLSGS